MGNVYGFASRVIIWLGPDPGESLDRLWRYLIEPVRTSFDESFFSLVQKFIRMSSLPWFSRVWVAQELALSATEPEIRLEYRKIPWYDAFRALKKLNDLLLNLRTLILTR